MLERATIGVAQWLSSPGDSETNLSTALGYIGELGRRGCDVIVLPELWPSGFDWDRLGSDLDLTAEPIDGPRTTALATAARSANAWLVAGSVPERHPDGIYNTALVFDRTGELCGMHRKSHLYAPLGEDRCLIPGNEVTVINTDELGTIGVCICFDGDFPEMARAMRDLGARIVLQPSAYELAAETWWDTLYPANALANGQWWVMANQCGSVGSGTLLGGSQIIAPTGEVLAQAVRAANGETPEPELLVLEVDLAAELAKVDAEHHVLWELRRPSLYAG